MGRIGRFTKEFEIMPMPIEQPVTQPDPFIPGPVMPAPAPAEPVFDPITLPEETPVEEPVPV